MFKKNVLIVEDDPQTAQKIINGLKGEDRGFFLASTVKEALKVLREEIINTIIIDRILTSRNGTEDGIEILKEIYKYPKKYRNPYRVILTAEKLTYADKKEGYENGVAVYFSKKTEFHWFILSINTYLKNQYLKSYILRYKKLVLNVKTCVTKVENLQFEISDSEFIILQEILKRPGQWLTREDIERFCWGNNGAISDSLVPTTVCRLKKKFRILEKNLLTKRGKGYYLRESDDE